MARKLKIKESSRISSIDQEKRLIIVPEDGGTILATYEDESKNNNETKQEEVYWIWSLISGQLNFTESNKHNVGSKKQGIWSFTNTHHGGMAFLEAFLKETRPTNNINNGYLVKADTKPEILGIEWVEGFEESFLGGKLKEAQPWKESVQLHIYTKGMYGSNLKIKLYSKNILSDEELKLYEKHEGDYLDLEDEDDIETNENTLPNTNIKEFKRTVKIYPYNKLSHPKDISTESVNIKVDEKGEIIDTEIQKAVVQVYIDPLWKHKMGFYSSNFKRDKESVVIEIIPEIICDHEVNFRTQLSETNYKITRARYYKYSDKVLKIKNRDSVIQTYLDATYGNKAVVVSKIETNPGYFHGCRINDITANCDGKNIELFPVYNEEDIYTEEILYPFVAGVNMHAKYISLSVYSEIEDCKHEGTEADHKGKVIDITELSNMQRQDTGGERQWRLTETENVLKDIGIPTKNGKTDDKSESKISSFLSFKTGLGDIKMQKSYTVLGHKKAFVAKEHFDSSINLEIGYDYSFGGKYNVLLGLCKCIFPASLDLAKVYRIKLSTCAHSFPLILSAYPDVKWTLQFAFNYSKSKFEKMLKDCDHKNNLREKVSDKYSEERVKKLKKSIEEGEAKGSRNKKDNSKLQSDRAQLENAEEALENYEKGKKEPPAKKDAIDFSCSLIAEFDRNGKAAEEKIDFSAGFDQIKLFMEKIADIKDLIDNIINGENTETTKTVNNKRKTKKEEERLEKIEDKFKRNREKKKSKQKWSFNYKAVELAASLCWYADSPKDVYPKQMGTQIEGMIKLDPLFDFEIKYDAYQLLYKIRHPAILAVVATLDVLDEALDDNFDIDLDFIARSKIKGDINANYNTVKSSKYSERLKKGGKSPAKLEANIEISLKGSIQVNGKFSSVFGRNIEGYAELNAEIKTGVSFILDMKMDNGGLFIDPTIRFDGLMLKAEVKAGITVNRDKGYDKGYDKEIDKDKKNLKKEEGFHFGGSADIILMDKYLWKSENWRIPLLRL